MTDQERPMADVTGEILSEIARVDGTDRRLRRAELYDTLGQKWRAASERMPAGSDGALAGALLSDVYRNKASHLRLAHHQATRLTR